MMLLQLSCCYDISQMFWKHYKSGKLLALLRALFYSEKRPVFLFGQIHFRGRIKQKWAILKVIRYTTRTFTPLPPPPPFDERLGQISIPPVDIVVRPTLFRFSVFVQGRYAKARFDVPDNA